MSISAFIMEPSREHRSRYIFAAFLPFLVTMFLLRWIVNSIPAINNSFYNQFAVYVSILEFCILSFIFIIYKRNHTLKIDNHSITEIGVHGQQITKISVKDILCVRQNIMEEILLCDINGIVLLRVEPYMTNITRFLKWMAAHNLYLK